MKSFWFIIFGFLVLGSYCEGTTTSNVFKKYPNRYFIETGSYLGDGIQNALDADIFSEIHSIELSRHYYKICKKRFKKNKNVKIWLGDSSILLAQVIEQIAEPATFWLDGHYSQGNTARGDTNSPILKELEIIRQHSLNIHTILIDDVRLFGTEEFDYVTIDEIKAKLLEINPNYTFVFEDGHLQNDVLVAYISE